MHRFGRVFRMWIEGMLARVQDNQHIHLSSKFHKHAGFRVAGREVNPSGGIHDNLAEEIDRGGQVSCRESVFRELDDKTVVCILMTVVAKLLVTCLAVLPGYQRGIGATAERIVPAHS